MTDVLMPALSPTMEEGTLAKWHVKVGDAVRSGDVIAEIETDKATMEVEAVDEGVVEALLVPEGTEEVKVNTPIARLKGEGEELAPAKPPQSAFADSSPLRGSEDRRGGRRQTLLPHRGRGDHEVVEGAWGAGRVRPRPAIRRSSRRRPPSRNRPRPASRRTPSLSASPCATPCATPWPRRCGATRRCS